MLATGPLGKSLYPFFGYRCPVVPTLVESTIFIPLYCLCYFVKDQLALFMRINFWALYSVPLIFLSLLSPKPQCLDCCSFTVSLDIGQCQSSNFVLLLQYCVGYSGSFAFPCKLQDQCTRCFAEVFIGISFTLESWWEELRFPAHDHRLYFYLFSSFFEFFIQNFIVSTYVSYLFCLFALYVNISLFECCNE